MNRIEVHCHFLPAVDDGCRDLDESLQCLRLMSDAGYSRIFCTPHVCAETRVPTTHRSEVARRVSELATHAKAAGINLELKPGGELRLLPELVEYFVHEELPSYGHAGKYLIADTWDDDWPAWQTRAIEWLQKKGLTVILAHPERMPLLHIKPDYIDELTRMGILFQGNLGPISGADSSRIVALAHRFLQEGRYFLLGTDGHRPAHMPQRLSGLDKARELVGAAVVDELTITNPTRLWGP